MRQRSDRHSIDSNGRAAGSFLGKGRAFLLSSLALMLIASSALAQDPATVGQWSAVMTWPYKAVHAVVLPNGKVMWWPSFQNGDNPHVWNWATPTVSPAPVARANANIFCSGHAVLPNNGQVFVAGGHVTDWWGLQSARRYNYSTNVWTQLADMNNGRWYPTCTILPTKDILVISGFKQPGDVNVEPQVWQASLPTPSWRNLTNAHKALPFYPFMFVAPNGQVFYAGPQRATQYLNVAGAGQWGTVINSNFGLRNWGSPVMYDSGKILLMGGTPVPPYRDTCGDTPPTYPTASAEIINLNVGSPAWSSTAPMRTGKRKLHNATILADGTVFISGGSRGCEGTGTTLNSAAYECELWNPVSGSWSTMASLIKVRAYHSIAVLLPDGRVLSAGGEYTGGGASAEVYSPPYLFLPGGGLAPRPTITSVSATTSYGSQLFVATPDQASIQKVTMIALSSVTHNFNMGQRANKLTFSYSTNPEGINVNIPASRNSMPPGYYLLFILNGNGVPSIAKIVRLS